MASRVNSYCTEQIAEMVNQAFTQNRQRRMTAFSCLKVSLCSLVICALCACKEIPSDPFIAYEKGYYSAALPKMQAMAAAGDAKAQTYLAAMYQGGLGIERNQHSAYKWYEKAAYQNAPAAQYNLGLMLREGNGVKADPIKAYGWLHHARDLGHPKADAQLDTAFFNLTPNKSMQAREWVLQELRKGKPDPQD